LKKAVASLDWSLSIECPCCHADFDLSNYDSEYDYTLSKAIFNDNWDDLIGEVVDCPYCGEQFEMEDVNY